MTLGKFNEFGKIAQGFFKISTFIAKHTDEIAREVRPDPCARLHRYAQRDYHDSREVQ
jgi:hypothetical protein